MKKEKKGRLHGPANLGGPETLRANFHPLGLPASHIDPDVSQVDEPAPSGVTVRVAYRIAGAGASSTAITKFGHIAFPPKTYDRKTTEAF